MDKSFYDNLKEGDKVKVDWCAGSLKEGEIKRISKGLFGTKYTVKFKLTFEEVRVVGKDKIYPIDF